MNRKNSGIDPGTLRLVAQCLNHYATPGPHPQAVLFEKHNQSNYLGKHQEIDIYIEGILEGLKHIERNQGYWTSFNPLNAELNPICCLLALLGANHFLHVSRIKVKSLTLRLLMSYIYMEHPFLIFLDHTQRRTTVGRTPLDE